MYGNSNAETRTKVKAARKPSKILNWIMGFVRALAVPIGLAGGVALTGMKLVALAADRGITFDASNPSALIPQLVNHWPAVGVILLEGLVAGAAIFIVFSYTVNNIDQRINNIWQAMGPITFPEGYVHADAETRDWVNKLTAKESAEQQKEILRLLNECAELKRDRDAQLDELARLNETLKRAGDRLKANERVFSQFEKLSRAMQSSIDRARQRYPI